MAGESSSSSSSSTERKLDQTPAWALAGLCAVMIIISISLEKTLHKLGTWFRERHKKALIEALEKVKSELMVLGFISLLLTFGQKYIAKICIPTKVADTMLPCPATETTTTSTEGGHQRRLLWYQHRILAAADSNIFKCEDGKVPLISIEGMTQLRILIFFLAVIHVLYSAVTMTLGRLKGCFFRQFFKSVSKSDYMTLRNGFISVHLAPGSKFDFQKYIKRSLENDFKTVVGVSPVLWASFVIFLLLNVHGWLAWFWASLIPLIIILAVGTKLQAILCRMALDITERHSVVQGIPLVQGSNKYFWFGSPQLVLHLIHFALFQNAFQITYYLWILYEFGMTSCFHNNFKLVILKFCLGIGALFFCSYITLPLYALIAQMGSRMKKSIFDEQTSKAIKKWHMAAKNKHGKGGKSPTQTLGGGSSTTASMNSTLHSSGATLHRFKTSGHSTRSFTHDDHETSDYEADPSTANLIVTDDHDDSETEMSAPHVGDDSRNKDDFSFVKPAMMK
ncbi:MLO-like protein 10 isoform X2 [Camellia sinensis]|uniref:MLO-like protein 10 isoform X2 n=1 Tax=Camellia sinensis TaxID=4442 RepID=UPI00103667DF|nr:MLO-like protein 10 isoform X2 [Camellia sinensis]